MLQWWNLNLSQDLYIERVTEPLTGSLLRLSRRSLHTPAKLREERGDEAEIDGEYKASVDAVTEVEDGGDEVGDGGDEDERYRERFDF
ncbi:hypothetical protein L195_g060319 [Trifolium pratense]|uniref:Uncharacterized protein n=1 Tax=Trifolium pratense TaxID=57577 RepID=A0A2K3K368_TRIPR|nr:hypothetical protein L195_g060319 [Trifolium pratense]